MNRPNAQPIVCGTDFSAPARQAADVAAMLAKRAGTKLLLVHGIDERGEIPLHYWRELIAENRPRLTAEADRLRSSGATVEENLAGAVPDDGFAQCAEKADARMIVVASSGLGAAGRWLMGSISERIAETAWVPTLVVRDAAVLEAWLRDERALRVFVAADFTPASDATLRWVEELTQIAPCQVTLGYVDREARERGEEAMRLPAGTPPPPEMHEMLTHDLREKARALFGRHDIYVHVLPAADRLDLRLLELAREANADLIVVGTHQWHGLNRLRHASVSRRILHEANVNIACVPAYALAHGANASIPTVRRVLAATDLSTHGGHAVPHAYSMLDPGGTVRLVHVIPPGKPREPSLARLRELIPTEAARLGIHTDVAVVENHDVPAGICEAAERFEADLVCIGSHGHSGFRAAAFGSVAQAVLAQSSRPVLAVRPPGA